MWRRVCVDVAVYACPFERIFACVCSAYEMNHWDVVLNNIAHITMASEKWSKLVPNLPKQHESDCYFHICLCRL